MPEVQPPDKKKLPAAEPLRWRRGSLRRLVDIAALVVLLGASGFYASRHADDIKDAYARLYGKFFPCTLPETYSFGAVDKRFKISQKDFSSAVQEAEKIWEAPAGRQLFTHIDAGGALTISLVYDYRQEATDKLRKLGITIDDSRATYDKLAAQHDALEAGLAPERAAFDAAVAAFNAREAAYTQQIAHWNGRGGAPKAEYERLNAERDALNAEAARLNAESNGINAKIDQINSTVTVINRLAKRLNLSAANYNGVVDSRGGEFEEGLFNGDAVGGTIDIYEFEDRAKLVRVLAHELGHALGLPHLEDPGAIMYRLNSGTNEKLTKADIAALKQVCRIK